MNIFMTIGLGAVGFFIGNLLFSRVVRWIFTVFEMLKPKAGVARAGVFAVLLLHDGPWLLVAALLFAYLISQHAWSTPIFVGAAIAFVFFGAITVVFARKTKKERSNAA